MTVPHDDEATQREICARHAVEFVPADACLKVGIAKGAMSGVMPIHGLRLWPTETSCGCYVWAGDEPSDDPDFFEPVHVAHLRDVCAAIVPYLGLPPGSRLVVADGYDDVWRDEKLLDEAPGPQP